MRVVLTTAETLEGFFPNSSRIVHSVENDGNSQRDMGVVVASVADVENLSSNSIR